MQARYGADPADVSQVAAFASQHGLTVAQVNSAARTVLLTGRTADFAQAFQVQFEKCGIHRAASSASARER